jgi:hypothetical protein
VIDYYKILIKCNFKNYIILGGKQERLLELLWGLIHNRALSKTKGMFRQFFTWVEFSILERYLSWERVINRESLPLSTASRELVGPSKPN